MDLVECQNKAEELMRRMVGTNRVQIIEEAKCFWPENIEIFKRVFNCSKEEVGDKIADAKGF
jgi:hypothetical protein